MKYLLPLLCCVMAASHAYPQTDSQSSRPDIVLVGDSTVTEDAGWAAGFFACLSDRTKCVNLARGGRSSSSFREEGLWDQALAMRPTWLLIQFGHNDEPGHPGKENEPDTSFRQNLQRYLEEARAEGIQPVLITPLSRRQWGRSPDFPNQIQSSLAPFARVVEELSRDNAVPLIDLHRRSVEVYQSLTRRGCEMISPRKEDGQLDNTHLNRAGANMFGSMVAMDCRALVPEMDTHFQTSKLMQLQRDQRAPSMGERGSRDDSPQLIPQAFPQGERTLVIDRKGGGDFRTLQQAIEAVPENNSDRTFIRLESGVYMGQVIIPRNKPNITLVGADRQQSIVSYALSVHDPIPPGVSRRTAGYGMVVDADGFQATNLTIRQISGDHGQAIALRLNGDRVVLSKCDLLGWQDTLRVENGRHYFNECRIEGRVDYIYGSATAVFKDCTLHTKGNGYVTAASTPQAKDWGFVFLSCTLTGTTPRSVFLGRPWRPWSSVTYLNCHMADCIRPEGWDNWRNPENETTARYAEYQSTGPGAAPDSRVAWSEQLSDAQASQATVDSILTGEDDWDALAACESLSQLPTTTAP